MVRTVLKAIPSSPLLSPNGVVGSAGGRPVTVGDREDPSGFSLDVSLPTVSSFRALAGARNRDRPQDVALRVADFAYALAAAGEIDDLLLLRTAFRAGERLDAGRVAVRVTDERALAAAR